MELRLPKEATSLQAIAWLKRFVHDFGLGFHLDTSPDDYSTPDGLRCFNADECRILEDSIHRLFKTLGDVLPYEVCAEEATVMLAELVHSKPPLKHHSPVFQQELLKSGTREQIIEWLCWNDPNGCYTDDDSASEGYSPLTLAQVRHIMDEQVRRQRST